MGHKTLYVRMNQVKNTCNSAITALERCLGVLSQSTPLTHIMMLCAKVRQPCNHLPQHPESPMVQVGHPPVPQLT